MLTHILYIKLKATHVFLKTSQRRHSTWVPIVLPHKGLSDSDLGLSASNSTASLQFAVSLRVQDWGAGHSLSEFKKESLNLTRKVGRG